MSRLNKNLQSKKKKGICTCSPCPKKQQQKKTPDSGAFTKFIPCIPPSVSHVL